MHVGLCYVSCVKYLNFAHLFSIKHVLDQIYCISSVVGSSGISSKLMCPLHCCRHLKVKGN